MGYVEEEVVRQSLTIAAIVAVIGCHGHGARSTPMEALRGPPPTPREFRAAWVATVTNIDWPSQVGLSSEKQREEIRTIVDRAQMLRLNAIVLQVRPSADAIYPSQLEPWTEYLTGREGEPPAPLYDPLATWIEEAHARGLELHAWFNPYRARHVQSVSPPAPNHVGVSKPEIVKLYGGAMWMDPGSHDAEEQTMGAILDVVRRYDVDGVHMDDYFYPYPVNDAQGREIDFPDDASWEAYLAGGGTEARAEWRRNNVTRLIDRIGRAVHEEKRWIKFGISPFGLGRPDRRPDGVRGFSQYDKLYANVEDWLERGLIDYLAPQLYWSITSSSQPFAPLLDSWMDSNPKRRAIYPGVFTSRTEDGSKSPYAPDEVPRQIEVTRRHAERRCLPAGNIHFSMKALLANRGGLADRLAREEYRDDAIPPAMPWLDTVQPGRPSVELSKDGRRVRLTPPMNKPVAHYAIWRKTRRGAWSFSRRDAHREQWIDVDSEVTEIAVSVIDRVGNESEREHARHR